MEQTKEFKEKNKHINRVIYLCITVLALIIVSGVIGYFAINSYINTLLGGSDNGMVNVSLVREWVREVLVIYYIIVAFFGLIMLLLTVFIIRSGKLVTRLEDENRAIDVAERANRAKTDFLANMSHEIRTPVNSILGFNEMIARETDQDVIAGYTEDIKGSGETLLFLINDILDFSKIESGNVEISERKYDVQELINNINNMIAIRATGKGLAYNVNIDPQVPKSMFGDKNRVQQIIINLLTNAVKYTDNGSVTFSMGWDDEKRMLLVEVADTGRGIKEEDIELLFNKFQRLSEEEGNIEGSGLGLMITKMLLNKMEGSIDLVSTFGEGSTFSVKIPQKPAGMEKIGHYEKPERRRSKFSHKFHARNARLLVVDDTVTNLAIMKGLLKDTGLIIDTASSGEVCLEMVRNTVYDIIFLDIRMPEMSGEEVLKKINTGGIRRGVPIVALTADALKESRDKFLMEGFTDYLAKPVNWESLERMIMQYLPRDKVQLVYPGEGTAGEVEKSQIFGLFRHLKEYVDTRNEEALKSMLGALGKYSFPEGFQERFNLLRSSFDVRDYNSMETVIEEILVNAKA